MTNDQPTPLSGENALLNAIWHSLESVPLGAVTDALPAIVAELRDCGYQITKAQVGVTITVPQARKCLDLLRDTPRNGIVRAVLEQAIAAAQTTDAEPTPSASERTAQST